MHDLKFKAVGSLAVPSNDGTPLTAAHEYQLQLAGAIIERSGIPDNWIVRYERACNRDRAPWLEVTFSPPKFLLRNDTGADAQNLTEEILSIVIGRYSLNTEHAVIMAGANDSRIVLRTPGHIYRLEPTAPAPRRQLLAGVTAVKLERPAPIRGVEPFHICKA